MKPNRSDGSRRASSKCCVHRGCVALQYPRNSADWHCRPPRRCPSTSSSPARKLPWPGSSGTTRCLASLVVSSRPEVRSEVFGDPRSLYAGSTRPSGRAAVGGQILSRQRTLVAGVRLRARRLGGIALRDRGERAATHAAAECARGSHGVVPARRAGNTRHLVHGRAAGHRQPRCRRQRTRWCRAVTRFRPSMAARSAGHSGRVPIVCNMAAGYGAQLLGMGQASVDLLVELVEKEARGRPWSGARRAAGGVRGDRRTQRAARRRAQSPARLRARLWDAAEAGPATPESIAEVFNAAHHAMAQGRAAVTAMYALAGTSALYTSSPLERIHRDMHAMAAHVIAQPMWVEDTGRVQLGRNR